MARTKATEEALVSCIMPTRNRRRFIPQALRCFANRTYRNAELIVVDDSDRSVGSLCEGVEGVRYLRVPTTPTGAKLNLGIRAAEGDILHKIDDDDYYAPRFLQTSVEQLAGMDPKRSLVTRCCFLTLIQSEGILRYSKHGWRAGGGLCFHRDLWKRKPFREIYRSSDSWFLRDLKPKIALICEPEQYVLVRHGRNTWTTVLTKATYEEMSADAYLGELPAYERSAEQFFGAEDYAFYSRILGWGRAAKKK